MKEKMQIIAEKLTQDGCGIQLIEEMSELTKAICKMRRVNGEGQPTNVDVETAQQNLLEEIADVRVSLYLYELAMGVTKEEEEAEYELYRSKVDRRYEQLKVGF
jgi:hypothetical protein